MSATSFPVFIANKYKSKSDEMKKYYGSLARFKELYIANSGLTPWLETLRDHTPSLGLLNSMVRTYIIDCDRVPGEIPSILASISRTYDVELPLVEGILTEEYWQKKAESFGWINRRMQ